MLSVVVAAAVAGASPQDGAQPVQATACELHVWPGSKLGSVYSGWVRGGIVNGAVTGRNGYPRTPADAINTDEQAALLKGAQPQDLLKLSDYRLVVHDQALPSSVIRRSATRISNSTSPCYAELIVDDVMLQHDDFVSGKYLKVLFRYREFGAAPAPTRVFGTWVQSRLTKFPPKTPEEEEAAIEEVKLAYFKNIAAFASALHAPRKKR